MSNHLNKICPVCGGDIILTGLGQMCEQCHYILPTPIAIQGYTGTAVGQLDPSPFTLHIKDCETIKFDVNGIAITANFGDVDFSKYEAIEINGHRFERVVPDTRTPMERLQEALDEVSKQLAPETPDYLESCSTSSKYTSDINSFCLNCPNHPNNGGSGICHCILGTPIIT